jgi:hypothetical protein
MLCRATMLLCSRQPAAQTGKALRIKGRGSRAHDANASRTSISKVISIGDNRTRRALLVTLSPNVTASASARLSRGG